MADQGNARIERFVDHDRLDSPSTQSSDDTARLTAGFYSVVLRQRYAMLRPIPFASDNRALCKGWLSAGVTLLTWDNKRMRIMQRLVTLGSKPHLAMTGMPPDATIHLSV